MVNHCQAEGPMGYKAGRFKTSCINFMSLTVKNVQSYRLPSRLNAEALVSVPKLFCLSSGFNLEDPSSVDVLLCCVVLFLGRFN